MVLDGHGVWGNVSGIVELCKDIVKFLCVSIVELLCEVALNNEINSLCFSSLKKILC